MREKVGVSSVSFCELLLAVSPFIFKNHFRNIRGRRPGTEYGKKKVVEGWKIEGIGYENDANDVVTSIYCKVCREFYGSGENKAEVKGSVEALVRKWIDGTTVVKKCNAEKHVATTLHKRAVVRLREKAAQSAPPESSSSTSAYEVAKTSEIAQGQSSIVNLSRNLNQKNRDQLIKKFQIAHFTALNNLSLKTYSKFANFEREVHGVRLGKSYLSDKAASEMIHYLAKVIVSSTISEPLNSGSSLYFSILFDGSSSAKTVDEKELMIIKTCDAGSPAYNVLALEEPEEVNAEGLKSAIDNAIAKAGFTFPRSDREIGLGSDGTSTNIKVAKLERQDVGEHVVQVLCPSHKVELAIKDAFKLSGSSLTCDEMLSSIYQLFRKATLKWRLFKRTAIFLNKTSLRYKRSSGTRWVAHQSQAIKVYLKNLPILISFLNDQITTPHNQTMKKEKSRLEGIRRSACSLHHIIFLAVKQDVLRYILPCSLALEELSLLMPRTVTLIENLTDTISRLKSYLEEKGGVGLYNQTYFPTINEEILPHLSTEPGIPIEQGRRADPQQTSGRNPTFYGCIVRGIDKEKIFEEVVKELLVVLEKLAESMTSRMECIVNNPLFTAAAVVLDVGSYPLKSAEDINESFSDVAEHFSTQLKNNGYSLLSIPQEISVIQKHVAKFCRKSSIENTWKQVFAEKDTLDIRNALQVVEICMVLPISNAEVERCFSFFSRMLKKDRLSLTTATQENLLRIRNHNFNNFEPEMYSKAVDLFLTEYPDGEMRKKKRRAGGYQKGQKTHRKKRKEGLVLPEEELEGDTGNTGSPESESDEDYQPEEVNLSEISSDESDWSEFSDSDS